MHSLSPFVVCLLLAVTNAAPMYPAGTTSNPFSHGPEEIGDSSTPPQDAQYDLATAQPPSSGVTNAAPTHRNTPGGPSITPLSPHSLSITADPSQGPIFDHVPGGIQPRWTIQPRGEKQYDEKTFFDDVTEVTGRHRPSGSSKINILRALKGEYLSLKRKERNRYTIWVFDLGECTLVSILPVIRHLSKYEGAYAMYYLAAAKKIKVPENRMMAGQEWVYASNVEEAKLGRMNRGGRFYALPSRDPKFPSYPPRLYESKNPWCGWGTFGLDKKPPDHFGVTCMLVWGVGWEPIGVVQKHLESSPVFERVKSYYGYQDPAENLGS